MNKPKLHLTSERNWMNDPNGLIYYKGKYHAFYQHFPYATQWGTMHWGHAVSDDMVNWTYEPIALFPSKPYDKNGCFSGSAIEVDGDLYLYYTSVKYIETEEDNTTVPKDNIFESSQAMIISKDGFNFDNFNDKSLIIPPIMDEKLGHYTHTRDPKVWKYKDNYYMIVGSKVKKADQEEHKGKLLYYRSKDAKTWEYINSFELHGLGDMWECPDIFNVNDNNILVMSPENYYTDGTYPTNNAVIGIVDFEEESCNTKFDKDDFRLADLGLDYYAPQTFIDKDGRRVQFGWLRMNKPFENHTWLGMMSLPRVIEVKNKEITTNVHPNISSLFTKEIDIDDVDFSNPTCIKATLKDNSKISIGGYEITFENNIITANRTKVFNEEYVNLKASTPKLEDECNIEVYIDYGVIETYINKGQYVISHIVNPLENKLQIDNLSDFKIYTI